MIGHKYGFFSNQQFEETKTHMRKQIFFLLLCVDPNTKKEYEQINVNLTFENILTQFDGLNVLLNYPIELVKVMSLLEAALKEYNSSNFSFEKYRKLILSAGSEVLKIEEVC